MPFLGFKAGKGKSPEKTKIPRDSVNGKKIDGIMRLLFRSTNFLETGRYGGEREFTIPD